MNHKSFGTLHNPSEKQPNIGQRVRVVVIKEMTYQGNNDESGADWTDDGKGERCVMFWEEPDGSI